METTTTTNKKSSMLAQVACSKGTEWMVSDYTKWQQRSPLPEISGNSHSSFMQFANRFTQKENQFKGIMALSFRSILLILGIILLFKGR